MTKKDRNHLLVVNVEEYSTDQELYQALGAGIMATKMFRDYRVVLSNKKVVHPDPEGFSARWFPEHLCPRDVKFEEQIWEFFLQLLSSGKKDKS
jgi:hypothetical protein